MKYSERQEVDLAKLRARIAEVFEADPNGASLSQEKETQDISINKKIKDAKRDERDQLVEKYFEMYPDKRPVERYSEFCCVHRMAILLGQTDQMDQVIKIAVETGKHPDWFDYIKFNCK